MSIDSTKTVAEIVLDHPGAAGVFQRHHIDFCCRGGMSLTAACEEKKLDVARVVAQLEEAGPRDAGDRDPREMPTPELVAHIVSVHHEFLRFVLPTVEQLAIKVARVHGEHEPSLPSVRDRVRELRETLEPHLDTEEKVLFPMLSARGGAEIERELDAMLAEHESVGEQLAELRSLARDFVPPDWACMSYRTLMRELAALEIDTLRHIHLENHVLRPRFKGPALVDVRDVTPRDRHPMIFRAWAGLARGDAMLLVNDHDPKPLRYQFAAEMGDTFDWTYVESGPEVWKVRISKTA